MGITGFNVILLWIIICLAQWRLREHYPKTPLYKTKFSPYSNWVIICSLSVILICTLLDQSKMISSSIFVSLILVILMISQMVMKRKQLSKSLTS
jgi:amino acid transporter, AAT family